MKLAVVVQRYGADLNGGAELHARYVAEHLARHADVEVLTTCARDYITWRNELDVGPERVNDVPVRRFPVSRERNVDDFGRRSRQVFEESHSISAELAWLRSEGPTSPALVNHLRRHVADYDYCIFFSFRYYHAYHGLRVTDGRGLLVPTAERDAALGLRIFRGSFRRARALMYNSFEERALINAVSGNESVPGVVVGIGSDVPTDPQPERFRQATGIKGPTIIYVGRIDENKGCRELFEYFRHYARFDPTLTLVLIGTPVMPVPEHPQIRHLGFVSDQEKFDALAAAELLIMPSYFESLSMVTLEAWALGRPVLANGQCDVLVGQCARSNAGLYYDSYQEFAEALNTILAQSRLRDALGANGRAYFNTHYTWPVIERKYLDMLDRLEREDRREMRSAEPLPGWLGRRRRDVPPGRELVDRLPTGAAPTTAAEAGGS
ncbi:MAG: glycosyltransferase family 4 protein [Acidobacteria bacterium]|nr:glycosyltransferase family 4 protein [Acidobacteriota bacterium]